MSSSRFVPLRTSSASSRAARASSARDEYEMHRLSASFRPPRVARSTWSTAARAPGASRARSRSEEHTSELQSPCNLVCRLLLEKKKKEREPYDATVYM